MKSANAVARELREQVEEATDPKDPSKLQQYTGGIRDGIEALVPMLTEDPTMAALAFHGQIQFVDRRTIALIENGKPSKEDWAVLKKAIHMRPQAHTAVKVLEEADLMNVLVIAVMANFKLKQSRAESAAQEEELEHV